jgi:tetratricopeptide (TPR) repeat protein
VPRFYEPARRSGVLGNVYNLDPYLDAQVGREGMGKSAVASIVLAGLEEDRWPSPETTIHVEGIAYFSARDPTFTFDALVQGCAALLPDDVGGRLARDFGNERLALAQRIDQLLKELAGGYRLTVLDDVEPLLGEDGSFADLRLRAFVEGVLTSRWPVHLLLISRVAPFLGSRAHAISRTMEMAEGLPVEDAMAMLRSTDLDNHLGIRDADEAEVREAVSRVACVPRAIELIATILETQRAMSLGTVVSGFFKDEMFVRDLIEETYAGLDEEDRRVLEALAVYRAPVPMEAVSALLAPVLPELDVPGAVVRLVRAHLVIADRTSQTVSASAIDQAYAYAQLPIAGPMSRRTLELRAAEYFQGHRVPAEGWKRITDLSPQIREFEHRLRGDDPDGASAALSTIEQHMIWYGNVELARWLRSRLDGRLVDPRQQALHAYGTGHVRAVLGPLNEARELFLESSLLAGGVPDERLKALALGWAAEANRRLGRLEEAMEQFGEAIPALEAFDDRREDVVHMRLLAGLTAAYLGDGTAALSEGEWLLANSPPGEKNRGRAYDCISLAYLVLGRLDEAVEAADHAIEAYTRSEDFEALPYAENVKGMAWIIEGRLDEALGLFERVEERGL